MASAKGKNYQHSAKYAESHVELLKFKILLITVSKLYTKNVGDNAFIIYIW